MVHAERFDLVISEGKKTLPADFDVWHTSLKDRGRNLSLTVKEGDSRLALTGGEEKGGARLELKDHPGEGGRLLLCQAEGDGDGQYKTKVTGKIPREAAKVQDHGWQKGRTPDRQLPGGEKAFDDFQKEAKVGAGAGQSSSFDPIVRGNQSERNTERVRSPMSTLGYERGKDPSYLAVPLVAQTLALATFGGRGEAAGARMWQSRSSLDLTRGQLFKGVLKEGGTYAGVNLTNALIVDALVGTKSGKWTFVNDAVITPLVVSGIPVGGWKGYAVKGLTCVASHALARYLDNRT